MPRPLINVPERVKRDAIFEIRVLISHPMESGQRRDEYGKQIQRDIIHEFHCSYGGEEVFRAEFFPAISANPFLSFTARAVESGVITLSWTDDHGATQFESVEITVE